MASTDTILNEQLQQQLRREHLHVALVRSPLALVFAPLLAFTCVAMLWSITTTPAWLFSWVVVLTALYGYRFVLRAQIQSRSAISLTPRWLTAHERVLRVVSFSSGFTWGLLAWLPMADSRGHLALSTMVLAGVAASAVTTLSSQRAAAMLFIAPCVLPIGVKFFQQGDGLGVGMAFMSLLYLVVLLGSVRQFHSYLTANGLLRLRTEADKSIIEERDHALRDQDAILQAITHSQSRFIQSDNVAELFDRLLVDILGLTQSKMGFIAETHVDEYGSPFLRTLALTNVAWDQTSRNMFEKHLAGELEFRNLNTLFGAVLTSKATVIANDPAQDARRGGLPPGHPGMDCFLGVPLLRGDEIVGVVGIANRAGGYQQTLVTHLDPVLHAITQIIYAYRTEAQRRLSEQETTRTRAQLETFVAYTPAAVVMVDTELRLLAYSERWRRDFSLPHGDLHNTPLYEVLPDTPARWRDCHQRALQGESEMEEADPYIGSDGHVRWFHWDVRPWYESADVIGGLVLFYDDVTETKRAVDSAHARERLLSKLTERVPGMLFQLRYVRSTKQLTLLYASNGSKELYGLTPEEIADDPEFIFRISHPADKAKINDAVKQAHSSGGIMLLEHRVILPSKGERWIRIDASLERLADASIIWHGYVQDITERREQETRLALSGL